MENEKREWYFVYSWRGFSLSGLGALEDIEILLKATTEDEAIAEAKLKRDEKVAEVKVKLEKMEKIWKRLLANPLGDKPTDLRVICKILLQCG